MLVWVGCLEETVLGNMREKEVEGGDKRRRTLIDNQPRLSSYSKESWVRVCDKDFRVSHKYNP